jgi:hypothetical protein
VLVSSASTKVAAVCVIGALCSTGCACILLDGVA